MVQNGAKAVGGIRYLPVGSKPTARMGVLGEDGEPDIKPLGQKKAALQKDAERKAKKEEAKRIAEEELKKAKKKQTQKRNNTGFVTQEIGIDFGKGERKVKAQVKGDVAFFKDNDSYTVVHVPTGLKITSFDKGFAPKSSLTESKKQAENLVNRLQSVDLSGQTPSQQSLQKAMDEIIAIRQSVQSR